MKDNTDATRLGNGEIALRVDDALYAASMLEELADYSSAEKGKKARLMEVAALIRNRCRELETMNGDVDLSEKDVENKFADIICEYLGVTPERCTENAVLSEDLGADGLDVIEIAMAVEEAFTVHLDLDESNLTENSTYGDYLDYVKSVVLKKNAAANAKGE